MGKILEEVERDALSTRPHLRDVLRGFLHDFDVTWGIHKWLLGSNLSFFFLRPLPHMREMFGLDREVLLIYCPYHQLEARVLQAANEILSEHPAEGRVDPLIFVLVGPAKDIGRQVKTLLADSTQTRVAIPFWEIDCIQTGRSESFFVRNTFQQNLFSRDLFDITQPVSEDLYFFGRQAFVLDLRDATRKGENVGVFGLRKTGKTSVLFRLKKQMEGEGSVKLVYLDLQDPALYQLRWWELLGKMYENWSGQRPQDWTEENAAQRFRRAVERAGQKQPEIRIIFALDEIEHISPHLRLAPHWDADFIVLWKTLRAIQNVNRHVSFIVCGVNASVIETPTFRDHENPLFNMAKIRYVPFFEREEVRQMVRTLGRIMGMKFEEPAYDYLKERYGGHPLLTRMACSDVHRRFGKDATRPILVTLAKLQEDEAERERALFSYGNLVLGMLQRYYPKEHEMLQLLANGEEENYRHAADELPEAHRHLCMYQLVQEKPLRLTLPFLSVYLRANRRRIAAETLTQDVPDDIIDLENLRKELDPLLRQVVKMVFLVKHGPNLWDQPIRRACGEMYEKITNERQEVPLKFIVAAMKEEWAAFEQFEKATPGKKVTFYQVGLLYDYLSALERGVRSRKVRAIDVQNTRIAMKAMKGALQHYVIG